MTRAFPTVGPAVHTRAQARGIDLEQSFRDFMAELLDAEPDSERVDKVIADGVAHGLSRQHRSKRWAA